MFFFVLFLNFPRNIQGGPVQDARQQRRPVSDDAVQRTGREHQVCPLVGVHQGGDARRDHRYAQSCGVQMPGVSGIRRVQACVGKLDGAAQPGSLRTFIVVASALSIHWSGRYFG